MNNSNINNPTIPSSSLSFKTQFSGGAGTSESPENFAKKKRSKRIQIGGDLKSSIGFLKPKTEIKKSVFSSVPNNIIRPTCSECGKKFSSWKALFGHMRCHPERQWRGMKPPSNFHQRPENHTEQQCEPDGLKFTEEDQEMATCLIMLANGTSYRQPVPRSDCGMLESGGERRVEKPSGSSFIEEAIGVEGHKKWCPLTTMKDCGGALDLNLPATTIETCIERDDRICCGCSSLDLALDLKLGL